MPKLRDQTLLEINKILQRNLPQRADINNHPDENPFLEIRLHADEHLHFTVGCTSEEGYFVTTESPGQFLMAEEKYLRKNFQWVLQALNTWCKRIQTELASDKTEPRASDNILITKKLNHDPVNELTDTSQNNYSDMMDTNAILRSYIVDITQ